LIAAIIQARMGATRLPNKPTVPIAEHTLLGWTILAVRASRLVDAVIVATTVDAGDDAVATHAREYGAEVFRGSEEDVLDRYLQAARHFAADVVVRISGDSPLWCPWASDFVIAKHQEAGVDYASNCIADVYPLGVQSEVFTTEALAASVAFADLATDHEHATPALRRHYPHFSVLSVLAPPELNRPQYRLCVDDQDDLAVARDLFTRLPHPPDVPPDLLDVCRELDADDALRARNACTAQKYKTGQDIRSEVPTVLMPLSYREEYYRRDEAREA
jgi:spore coat polysaccharide biosynthesis protein SpsF (cytidylyltransferase family)